MGDRCKGRVAVITGSGQGIGRETAMLLASEGARIVTNSRQPGTPGGDAETTAKTITGMGGEAVWFFGDISRFDVAQGLIRKAVDSFGRVDILINNAGGKDMRVPIWEATEAGWHNTVGIHLQGAFNCTRHASGLMKEQGWGRILNATSIVWLGAADGCYYASAMAGVVGLTRTVARDLGKYGATCNAYSPLAGTRRTTSDEQKARYKKRYESGFMTKERYEAQLHPPGPETVAPMLVYLCTEAAADINGQVFAITGGKIGIIPTPEEQNDIVKEQGWWTLEEVMELVPRVVLKGYKNPAPVQPSK